MSKYGGGNGPTISIWFMLLQALAMRLSPDVHILQDEQPTKPRAQNVATQSSNLIDGRASLLAAHVIFSTSHSDRSSTNTRNEEDQDESTFSGTSLDWVTSLDLPVPLEDQDESVYSADSDTCDGLVDSLNLPKQAHMLRSRGKRICAVVPVLLVADLHNIVPLVCSALYQRRVWGIHQPVVGLICSKTGTTATAIFGWLESNQSEEGRMPTAHLALAEDAHLDPLMGVFDFTDLQSVTSLAQFVLRLRTHFQDVKDATSIEAVNSVPSLCWRSDLPDFENQIGEQFDGCVAS